MRTLTNNTRLDNRALVAVVACLAGAPAIGYLAFSAPKLALLATFAGLFELVLLKRPHWGAYLIVAGQSFDMGTIHLPAGFAAFGVGDLAAIAVIPAWLLRRLIEPRGCRVPAGAGWLIAFLLLVGASVLLGVRPAVAYGAYIRLLVYVAALMALVDLAQDQRLLTHLAWILAACGTVHALIAFAGAGGASRLSGLVDQPNLLGATLAFGVIPAIGLLMRPQRKVLRLALLGAVGLMLLGILFTVSRGTYISLTITLLWWLRRHRRSILLAALVGGALFVTVSRYKEQQAELISRRFEMRDSSVRNRWQVIQNALEVVAARPLFGVGFAQFAEIDRAVDIRREAGRGSHSFYLGLAASTGLPALLCLLMFIAAQARRMRTARQRALAASGPDAEHNAWLIGMLQALALYHGLSLLIRGGTRITEWTMLALYCCAAALVAYDYSPPEEET